LSKGKDDKALEALRWLRGWTSKEEVQAEFDDMCLYAQTSGHSTISDIASIKDIFRGSIMKPFFLIVFYQFFYHCVGLSGARGYMIEIFSALEMPVSPEWSAVSSNTASPSTFLNRSELRFPTIVEAAQYCC